MTSTDVARMTVNLGDHNIRSAYETQHISKKVKRVVRHRSFDARTLYNDVALLTLDSPVQYSKSVRPICLPNNNRNYGGQYGTVIGWGSLRESESLQTIFSRKISGAIFSKPLIILHYYRRSSTIDFTKSFRTNLVKSSMPAKIRISRTGWNY